MEKKFGRILKVILKSILKGFSKGISPGFPEGTFREILYGISGRIEGVLGRIPEEFQQESKIISVGIPGRISNKISQGIFPKQNLGGIPLGLHE